MNSHSEIIGNQFKWISGIINSGQNVYHQITPSLKQKKIMDKEGCIWGANWELSENIICESLMKLKCFKRV